MSEQPEHTPDRLLEAKHDTPDQTGEIVEHEPAADSVPEPYVKPKRARSRPAPEPEAEAGRYGKVINAPTMPNNGGYENRVTAPANAPGDRTSGFNATSAAHAFEQRVTQESGAH